MPRNRTAANPMRRSMVPSNTNVDTNVGVASSNDGGGDGDLHDDDDDDDDEDEADALELLLRRIASDADMHDAVLAASTTTTTETQRPTVTRCKEGAIAHTCCGQYT